MWTRLEKSPASMPVSMPVSVSIRWQRSLAKPTIDPCNRRWFLSAFLSLWEKENASPAPVYAKHAEYAEHTESGAEDDRANVFSAFVGFDGSMKTQITRAQAAVLYPPRGLHCLIYGPSGVGKSFLAELMHEYACGSENFGKDAPYFEFNCADYADNPQLLLAQLFGYSLFPYSVQIQDSIPAVLLLCHPLSSAYK